MDRSAIPGGPCLPAARRLFLLRLGCLVLALFSGNGAVAAGGTLAQPVDLREDGAAALKRGQPLLLMFSMPDCQFCPEVRENYLAPLAAAGGQGPVVREVDITSTRPIRGFGGESVNGVEIGKRYRVRATPTVLMLDDRGELLTDPLVGSGMAGFYGAYLDRALETARARLASRPRKGG